MSRIERKDGAEIGKTKETSEFSGIFPPVLGTSLSTKPVDSESMINIFLARPSGLCWPWKELAKLNEIDIGSITTLIAGTSHGKTAVAISLALHCLQDGKRVLFWSGEMPPEILTVRMLNILGEFTLKSTAQELHNYRAGIVSAKIHHAVTILKDCCERLFLPPAWRFKDCEQLLSYSDDVKPDILIIDYLQQLRPGTAGMKYRTRDEEIESVMDVLNLWAITNRVPILNFAQINREARNIVKPNLTCIRHSATIEQYSANVIGIWNASMARYKGTSPSIPIDGWYWTDDDKATSEAVAQADKENKSLLELIILKSRYHGNVGKSVPLIFDGPTSRIKDFPEHSSAELEKVIDL